MYRKQLQFRLRHRLMQSLSVCTHVWGWGHCLWGTVRPWASSKKKK